MSEIPVAPPAPHTPDPLPASGVHFNGAALDYFIASLKAFLVVLVTLGIAARWAVVFITRWTLDNVIVQGKQLRLHATGGQYFLTFWGWTLLTAITLASPRSGRFPPGSAGSLPAPRWSTR